MTFVVVLHALLLQGDDDARSHSTKTIDFQQDVRGYRHACDTEIDRHARRDQCFQVAPDATRMQAGQAQFFHDCIAQFFQRCAESQSLEHLDDRSYSSG